MNLKNKSSASKNYDPPKKALWTGRYTKPEMGKQYWYQHIELINLKASKREFSKHQKPDVALVGYACDEGVRRNMGRVGTKKGADKLRNRLAKLPYHHLTKTVVDVGNIKCENPDLESCHKELSKVVSQLISKRVFPIVIGGGHDVAYGHFKGLWGIVKNTSKPKIGIINFDAHFDLRPLEKEANSGTPFNQILTEHKDTVEYFAIGIQLQSNTKELVAIAKDHQVTFLQNDECNLLNFETIKNLLSLFIERNDGLYVTIDMDGFSSAYAPGVSAPSPLGFTPHFALKVLEYIFSSQKVISCDIAELNPDFDLDDATANLAARIVDFIVSVL